MKIAIVSRLFPARSETFVSLHAEKLAANGHEVHVFANYPEPGFAQEETSKYCQLLNIHYAFGCSSKRILQLIKVLERAISTKYMNLPDKMRVLLSKDVLIPRGRMGRVARLLTLAGGKYDVVHVHFGNGAEEVCRLKRLNFLSGKLVVTWHGVDLNVIPLMYGHEVYKNLFSLNPIHTVGSDFSFKKLTNLGAKATDVHKIPMGIDLGQFALKANRKVNDRNPLRLISVGRLVEAKGHAYLLRAVLNILREGRRLELTVIGDGPEKTRLVNDTKASGYDDQINFVGTRSPSEIVEALSDSDVFVLTGIVGSDGSEESQGVVFAEAQAVGLPVIASDVGGVPESVLHKRSGLLCSPRDVTQIENAIRFFMDNPKKTIEYGLVGSKYVESRFGVTDMINKFESIYRSIQ